MEVSKIYTMSSKTLIILMGQMAQKTWIKQNILAAGI